MTITSYDIGIWIFRMIAIIACISIVYSYIDYKKNMAKANRARQQHSKRLPNAAPTTHDPIPLSGEKKLDMLLQQGFCIGLDVGVVSKYPQLLQRKTPDRIFITEEVSNSQKSSKVVGIQQYHNIDSMQTFKTVKVKESFVERIGLDPASMTDRAIGSYLYAEKTDLIQVVFISLDPNAVKRAAKIGLRAELV
jgi:hypothetical protein